MTPRPIFRWKTFWIGILVLTFLGWAWIRSMSHFMTLRVTYPHGYLALSQLDGNAAIFKGQRGGPWELRFFDQSGEPALYRHLWQQHSPGIITVPHGYLVILCLLPWTALLVWRWRLFRQLPNSEVNSST